MNDLTSVSDQQCARGTETSRNNWSRKLIFNLLARLKHGRLILRENGCEWTFGSESQPHAVVTIHDKSVYKRVLFGGSIGAGEAYVEKLWDVDDLTALVRIMVLNMSLLDRMEQGFAWLLRPFDLLRHFMNTNNRKKAKKNILAHYDLGNDMYASFLDPTMMYSSAIYPSEDASLEEAQLTKMEELCKKLEIQATDSVIEIGTGWGGFAIYAAGNYGCHVTTTTISDAQYQEAARRIAAAGLSDRITLLQQDYRELQGKYDKLVSIEMIEAVGDRYLPVFFEKCSDLLKPDGKMVLQAITIADQKYKQYVKSVDFIQRYIFPGGCVPSINRMVQLIANKTDMVVRLIDDFGFDYARTLKDWLQRFQQAYPALETKGYDETFQRLWEYYLCYCQGGFLERSISVVHVVAAKPGNRQTQQRSA